MAAASAASASIPDTEIKVTDPNTFSGQLLGWDVDTDGTTAIAAAIEGQPGVAFLFDQATGAQLHKLTGATTLSSPQFAASAAVNGDYAIVGSPNENKAWVFDVATGNQIYELTGSDLPSFGSFGASVDISGDRAIVGAEFGAAAYIFDLNTGDELHKLVQPVPLGSFGNAVAIDGDLAIVGADGDLGPSGKAEVYDVATGQHLQTLTASDGELSDSFGFSVAIDGTTAVVGARAADPAGAVYVYDVVTGDELLKLAADDIIPGDQFGYDVAISGNVIAAGALFHQHDPNEPDEAGAAYFFDATTGQQLAELVSSDVGSGDSFGASVGLVGNQFIAGSPFNGFGAGAAYLYTIPEPSAALLALLALAGLLAFRRHPAPDVS